MTDMLQAFKSTKARLSKEFPDMPADNVHRACELYFASFVAGYDSRKIRFEMCRERLADFEKHRAQQTPLIKGLQKLLDQVQVFKMEWDI